MPAIHLPRLKKQVSELVLAYAEPELFTRKLRDLLAYYGDRTRRVSKQAAQPTGLPNVNLPQPVIKEIVTQMTPYAQTTPRAVLVLVRILWSFTQLEHRQIATQLLGRLPGENAEDVLGLVTTWSKQNHEEAVLISMSTHSLAALQRERPSLLLDHIKLWLTGELEEAMEEDRDEEEGEEIIEDQGEEKGKKAQGRPTNPAEALNLQKLALTALPPLVRNPQFENLPRVYTILDPILLDSPKILRPYILDVLKLLAVRAPQELAFILKKHLSEAPSNHIKWLARRVYTDLPEEFHPRLYPLIFSGKG